MHSALLENWQRLCATGRRKPSVAAFAENTTTTDDGDRVCIACKKGLWSVDAPTKEDALREARHYFAQYYQDGEYDS